ncbi:MAG: M14 metallopeptidase family protein [Chitinophagales bacterium]
MIKAITSILFLSFVISADAQLKSPEQFLGYRIGTHYTPHWKVVNYFQYVAANASTMVKLQQYGETNEGRPLIVAFVSTTENIQNLENIRKNNLRLANQSLDKMAAIENTPAIVWLSYNVHGNEASSTEAAMMVLYALADLSNAKTKDWLKNIVLVIDPCVNPDGRDRYVNWFNSIVGKDYNPSLNAREHAEPWPGGRTNHYNFDLNRDWAWQTQIESQQRLKLYNEWLPQVHVDYHEQGVNNPYYFAPAAEPYHEVITPWQREFQITIGKNHAKYFDENGWLYFTKEEFDLFYPSYGDTYPVYNGAIGMTYEQAGNTLGGLGVMKDDGDTLTLVDRVLHHYTTSLSTIEISSQNAERLIKEFHKFFNDAATTGVGEYKSYIIKNSPGDEEKIKTVLGLLDRNKIIYSAAKAGNANGYNYYDRKNENFLIDGDDILVSSLQPKSALAKVLFEPNGKLVDSITYDITAWSLPYVYGLNAYATKQNLVSAGAWSMQKNTIDVTSNYGYALKWSGIQTVKTVAQLLKAGVKLRFTEEPFELSGNKFDRGSILILKTGNNSNVWDVVKKTCNETGTTLYPISTGFVDKGFDFGSSKVHFMKTPKLALVTGSGISPEAAGEAWFLFEQELNYPLTLINLNDLSKANWNSFDVLIMPNGNYPFLSDKNSADQFHDWISKGGKVIALEGAVSQLSKLDWAIKMKKPDDNGGDKKDTTYGSLHRYEDREREPVANISAGSIYKVELDNTHPLAFGYPNYYYTLKQDDAIYEFMKDGWNVGIVRKDEPVAGFVGYRLKPRLKDGLLFGVQNVGQGAITYFADDVLFRDFWQNGKLMFCNAVFLVGQ